MKPSEQYKHILHHAYSTATTFDHSYWVGQEVVRKGLKGDIVECGIAAGANLAAMVLGLRAIGGKNKPYGYDSFEGIQLAGKNDTEQAGIGKIMHDVNVPESELLVSSGVTVHDELSVITNLTKWIGEVGWELVSGWVQHTIPNDYHKSIAVLRLDMDVYDPTMHVLKHFYPIVESGGFVIIDDWGLTGVRKAVQEYREAHGITDELISTDPGNDEAPVYWVKVKV